MSLPVKNPTFIAGTPRSSGGIQTGEVPFSRGGDRAYTSFSGAPGDTMIFSGAGRLMNILSHVQMQSGLAVVFYDGAVATSGGPFPASGHKVVGILPPYYSPIASGVIVPWTGAPFQVDMPFQSGLAFAGKSGQPGFTVSIIPEVDSNFPNA